jgi:hypothetical protein
LAECKQASMYIAYDVCPQLFSRLFFYMYVTHKHRLRCAQLPHYTVHHSPRKSFLFEPVCVAFPNKICDRRRSLRNPGKRFVANGASFPTWQTLETTCTLLAAQLHTRLRNTNYNSCIKTPPYLVRICGGCVASCIVSRSGSR